MQRAAMLCLALLAVPALAGCLNGGDDDGPENDALPSGLTSVFERKDLDFRLDDTISHTLEAGEYEIESPGRQFFATYDIPATELGAGLVGLGAGIVSIGVHFPVIEGCDWGASDLPDHCNIPVVADVGPYYGNPDSFLPQLEGDVEVTSHSRGRLFGALVENLVPHGYALAAVSVPGTGKSNHCQDLGGPVEQAAIDAAVTFLGDAAWSNGNVGLIGRSYDGTTPWEAAMYGNPALKTIVPISGLLGMHDLMWRNGSAESRGPALLWAIYQAFTVDADGTEVEMVCRNSVGPVMGLGAYLTGDMFLPEFTQYWAERSYGQRVLENYEGSVYYIHGLQDWNVDPHMAFPFYQQLIDNGNEVKGLFGQWGHHYPDRYPEHENLPAGNGAEAYPQSVRYDWAQDLLEWFDHYLMETGPKPMLWAEVQDNLGNWRVESTYPPADIEWHNIGLDQAESISNDCAVVCLPAGPVVSPVDSVVLTFPPISETTDTQLSGLHRLHIGFTPTGPGGQLAAELRDAETGLRFGHAIMDLRFAEGDDPENPTPVMPGQARRAHLEFQAFDALLPAGHGLELVLTGTVKDYLPSVISTPVVIDTSGESVLKLSVDTDPYSGAFTPPVWYEE